jgi:hypothetical protein
MEEALIRNDNAVARQALLSFCHVVPFQDGAHPSGLLALEDVVSITKFVFFVPDRVFDAAAEIIQVAIAVYFEALHA